MRIDYKNKAPVFLILLLILAIPRNAAFAQDLNLSWVKRAGGAGVDAVGSVAVDAAGNVYTCGLFEGTCDFDPGPGVYNLVSNGNRDVYISKQDPAGNLVWAKALGGPNNDQATAIAIDASGNIYLNGFFFNTVDFDPGAGIYNLSSSGQWDIFILKLDGSGNFIWARQAGGPDYDEPWGLALDAAGNVYTCGEFASAVVDFDPGPGVFNVNSKGNTDAFILKLDAAGNFVWVKQIGGTSLERAHAITVDAPGNIYVTGDFFDFAVDFDPGPGTYNLPNSGTGDIFVMKLDPAGDFVWARQMGGINNEQGNCIAVDAAGNVYTSGHFLGPGDYDPGPGVFTLSSISNTAIFISKLDASGNFVWAKQFSGTVSDPMVNNGSSLAIDAAQNLYITGGFVNTVDFDPGPGTRNLTSAGWWDIYIAVLNPAGDLLTVKQMGGNYIDAGADLAIDGNGSVYLAGEFNTTADFEPCAGTYNIVSYGADDIFLAKFSVPAVTISAGSTVICQGMPVTFTANIINGGLAPAYQWQVNGVNAGTNSNTFTSSTLNNNDKVTCIVTVNPTCAPPVTATSNSISITVDPGVTPSVSIATASTTICTGTSVSFIATPVNGGAAPVYQWKVNGINTGTNAPVFTSSSLADNDVVSLTMTNPSPCASPNTVNSNSILMHVNNSVAPSVSIIASANNICPGIPVTFTATPANTGTPPVFQWKLNGNDVGTNSTGYLLSNPANGDNVYCVMNSASVCSTNPLINSNTITMLVNPLPVITFNPPHPTMPAGGSVQLQATINSGYTGLLWTPAAGLSNTTIPNPVANPGNTTTYKLEVFTAANCNSSKTITVTVTREIYIPDAFTPDGNGTNDIFRIPPGTTMTLQQFLVYNRYGNLVFSTHDINKGWDGTFNGARSPAGAYTYIIRGLDARGHEVFLTGMVTLMR